MLIDHHTRRKGASADAGDSLQSIFLIFSGSPFDDTERAFRLFKDAFGSLDMAFSLPTDHSGVLAERVNLNWGGNDATA